MTQNNGSNAGEQSMQTRIRMSRIMIAALATGLVMFSGVVVYLRLSGSMLPTLSGSGTGPGGAPPEMLLIGVMAGLTAVTAIVGFMLRRVTAGTLRKKAEHGEKIEESTLLQQYQKLTIVRAALADGPALFAIVIVMLTGNWLVFIGTGVGLLMLLVVMPSRGKFDDFVRAATGHGGYG